MSIILTKPQGAVLQYAHYQGNNIMALFWHIKLKQKSGDAINIYYLIYSIQFFYWKYTECPAKMELKPVHLLRH